jgi:uncharacterized membrane protein
MLDVWLIVHFIGLALGVGTSFATLTLGPATRDMPPAERANFMRRASVISKNGSIGLLLLIVSGLGLMFGIGVEGVMIRGGAMFHAKLTLVVVLMGAVGYLQVLMRKSRTSDGAAAAARMPLVSRLVLLLGLSIVVFAVLAFH